MMLLTRNIEKKLRDNYRKQCVAIGRGKSIDFKPVVKFFNPVGASTWLFTELDDDDRLFGLCDLGMGFPELGYVMLDELKSIKLPFGMGIERDRFFVADKTLREYANEARKKGRIAA